MSVANIAGAISSPGVQSSFTDLSKIEQKNIYLPEIGSKKTLDCFSDQKKFPYRSNAIDQRLPLEQLSMSKCVIKRFQNGSYSQYFNNFLKAIFSISTKVDFKEIIKVIKERGFFLTLPQVEQLISRETWERHRNKEYYAFVCDRKGDIVLLRVYARPEEYTFGVQLANSHHVEPHDVFYIRWDNCL